MQMNKRTAKILIGDLLCKAGMVELGDLADAIPISTKTGLPVGRVLVGSGLLSDAKLHDALRSVAYSRQFSYYRYGYQSIAARSKRRKVV